MRSRRADTRRPSFPRRASVAALVVALLAGATITAGAQSATRLSQVPPVAGSPCAPPIAVDPMPDGGAHDHEDPAQHRFACRLRQVAALDLREQIPERMMFGEVSVAGDLAVVATTFPEAGFVALDVSDPANPLVLSRFRGPACEVETDLDCGADVKLRPDGRVAYLAVQRSFNAPSRTEDRRIDPGVIVVDLTDPRRPRRTGFTRLPPVGVHMLASHEIGGAGYVFARARNRGAARDQPGVAFLRADASGSLRDVGGVATDAAHDVFLYDDEQDRTTYLFVAAAQAGELLVYDVGDVTAPKHVGTWKPPVERPGNVWYIHEAWTFRHGGRRYTFTQPELYRSAFNLPTGHADVAGPIWLLDTTDLRAIRVAGEWRNPGGRAGGNLVFSPHNTTYAGNGITWSAHYHGGVWVLDWSDVLAGRARRPREVGYHVPHTLRRDFVDSGAKERFITAPELLVRPLVWDVVPKGRYGFASDINGGFVVLERTDAAGRPLDGGDATSAPSPAASPSPRESPAGSRVPIPVIVLAILVVASLPLLALRRRDR